MASDIEARQAAERIMAYRAHREKDTTPDGGFADIDAARAAAKRIMAYRAHRGRSDLLSGAPIPMAMAALRLTSRGIAAINPADRLLTALAAGEEVALQAIARLCDRPSLSRPQRLRLSLLRWLTGEQDIAAEATATAVRPSASPANACEERRAPIRESRRRAAIRLPDPSSTETVQPDQAAPLRQPAPSATAETPARPQSPAKTPHNSSLDLPDVNDRTVSETAKGSTPGREGDA